MRVRDIIIHCVRFFRLSIVCVIAATANVTTTMSTKPPSVPLSTDTTVAISTTKSLPSGRASVTSDEGSDVGSDAYESDSSYGR